jgi:5-formyltetrahydrofolate cyclo-ligase
MDATDKPRLRQDYRDLREGLPPEEVAAASQALCERLAAWPVLQDAACVMAYLAFRNEPDLGHLFDLLPAVGWVVPRIEGERMILHPYDPSQLVRHRLGMLEPASSLPVVAPAAVDVVLAPGVAFSPRGERLGFGGGFYDRFLIATPALRVGIAYDACLADSLPCDAHDQRMDWVVTQSRRMRCAPEGPPS